MTENTSPFLNISIFSARTTTRKRRYWICPPERAFLGVDGRPKHGEEDVCECSLLCLSVEEGTQQSWLCGEFFSMADVSLAVTLHRLKFLGLSRRYWGNGTRVNLESYYERVLERPTFRRVLGHVNNILISAVLPTAFRVARKRVPTFIGTTVLIGLFGGATYFAFLYFKKRLFVP